MRAPELTGLHALLLHLPIVTTLLSVVFCIVLFARYRAKGGGRHLLWWGLGMATFGVGTLTEAYTTLFGWHPAVFRCWYATGALLGGFPLAQGSIYLLMNRRFADWSARIGMAVIAAGTVLVFLSPLDLSLAEPHRLSGRVFGWQWVRAISPFINLYALAFLVGGAALSARRFRRFPELRHRYLGNISIAVGGLLPGIGGAATRAGYVEVLYVTELVGMILIFFGYRLCVRGGNAPARVPSPLPQAALIALLLAVAAAPSTADEPPATTSDAPEAGAQAESAEEPAQSFFDATTVTATGYSVETFDVTTSVSVLAAGEIEKKAADNPAELLRELPGTDIEGVGPNQGRPVIRGQRGLRVLFMEDGLRLNNPRRQTDFGEISSLVNLNFVEAVEVVRGPASVLYGSDAVGGVLNVITKVPTFADGGLGGSAALRYGTAGDLGQAYTALDGRRGRLRWSLGLSARSADDYQAAAGDYGDIHLDEGTTVSDSGVDDDHAVAYLAWQLADRHALSLRSSRYRADQAGFGFVESAELGAVGEDFRIRILYPFHRFDRHTLSYEGSTPGALLGDSVAVRAYWQSNERQLVNDIDINIGPLFPGAPDSSVAADTRNFTDLDSFGGRAQVIKAAGRHLLSYGADYVEDDSRNTDFSITVTTLRFPFPPFQARSTQTDAVANAPNATNRSYGAFAQDEIALRDRLKVTIGARYQNVATHAEPTAGWDVAGLDFDDDRVVGAVSALYEVNDSLHFVGSYGTAFRAASIIERLFNGPTPEGAGFQILNPELTSERSRNYDLGIKVRRANAHFEAIYFHNEISDGIIQHFLTAAEIAALPPALRAEIEASRVEFVVQQRNADRLRYQGVEVAAGYRHSSGVSVGGNYSHLNGKRLDSTNPPTGQNFSDKVNFFVRWQQPGGRWWLEYRLRHNGDEKANLEPGEPPPLVGDVLPSFTVHGLSGEVAVYERGSQRHALGVVVENLTDELYAEFANAAFFRPEPKRAVHAMYRVRF